MKKITLSAAILAMTMMGCSDMGIDNSVASTNDVKQEQSHNSLAKVNGTPYVFQEPLAAVAPNGGLFSNSKWLHYPNVGIDFTVKTYIDPGSFIPVGELHMDNGPTPDYFRITTYPLYNCGIMTIDKKRQAYCNIYNYNNLTVEVFPNVRDGVTQTDNIDSPFHPGNGYQYEKLNVITYYIAVWNEGKSNQVILAGTIYNGNQLQNRPELAQMAYEKYFLPAQNYWIVTH